MAQRVGNYLRVRRRQSALTQKELAFLLGYGSEGVVSRFERHERRITLAIAFACELILGAGPRDLFPVLLEQVEDGVVRRMYELYERLKDAKPSRKTAAKLQLLHEALARATKGATPREI
jgi:transcriptional regulator with XRE-family HTH domain